MLMEKYHIFFLFCIEILFSKRIRFVELLFEEKNEKNPLMQSLCSIFNLSFIYFQYEIEFCTNKYDDKNPIGIKFMPFWMFHSIEATTLPVNLLLFPTFTSQSPFCVAYFFFRLKFINFNKIIDDIVYFTLALTTKTDVQYHVITILNIA